jgi:hypothetical protein
MGKTPAVVVFRQKLAGAVAQQQIGVEVIAAQINLIFLPFGQQDRVQLCRPFLLGIQHELVLRFQDDVFRIQELVHGQLVLARLAGLFGGDNDAKLLVRTGPIDDLGMRQTAAIVVLSQLLAGRVFQAEECIEIVAHQVDTVNPPLANGLRMDLVSALGAHAILRIILAQLALKAGQ